jgi:tRNA 2-thiouridine synthesizing protein A
MVATPMNSDASIPGKIYDLRGLNCPMPVLKIRKRLSEIASGETLVAQTTDPMAVIDIPHFCNQYGHTFISCEKIKDGHLFMIRNGG